MTGEILCTNVDYWWSNQCLYFIACMLNVNSQIVYKFYSETKKYKYPLLKMISYKKRIDKDYDDSDCSDD